MSDWRVRVLVRSVHEDTSMMLRVLPLLLMTAALSAQSSTVSTEPFDVKGFVQASTGAARLDVTRRLSVVTVTSEGEHGNVQRIVVVELPHPSDAKFSLSAPGRLAYKDGQLMMESAATKWLFQTRGEGAVKAAAGTIEVLKISSFHATKPQTHKALVETLIAN